MSNKNLILTLFTVTIFSFCCLGQTYNYNQLDSARQVNSSLKSGFILQPLMFYSFKQFDYALGKIKLALENESSWNYLKGLLLSFGTKTLSQYEEVKFPQTFMNLIKFHSQNISKIPSKY